MQLFASSSCPDTDFMVKLTDVYPDGRSVNVLDGAIRARYRESLEYEKMMETGEDYEDVSGLPFELISVEEE
jgi:predicted acyl esterase